jgi:hypothetical protein
LSYTSYNQKIKTFDGSFLTSLTKLTHLSLDKNSVTTLPNLENLTCLKQLSLCDNNLGSFFHEHPEYKFPLHLANLKLFQNGMTVCPDFSTLASLRMVCYFPMPIILLFLNFVLYYLFLQLDLSDNKIRELPPSLLELKNVKRLILAGNELSTLPIGFENGWQKLEFICIHFFLFWSFLN